jgi:predicted RecB family nuclease
VYLFIEEGVIMTVKREGLYIWVTWLSRLMAGEAKCQWAPWFRTHYTEFVKAPSDFQLAIWQAEHTQLLDKIVKERTALGEGIYVENQNSFKVPTSSGSMIAGKPDLVTIDKDGKRRVFDAKTGNPKQSDTIQLMLYMLLLPHVTMHAKQEFTGYLVYKTHTSEVPMSAIDSNFRGLVKHFLSILESETPPGRVSSRTECRYCEITRADCPDKIETMAGDLNIEGDTSELSL